jgi:hypothetical protein
MSRMTLDQLEESALQLDLADQLRLVQTLLPRVAGAILSSSADHARSDAESALQRVRAAGDRLAAASPPGSASIVDELTHARR